MNNRYPDAALAFIATVVVGLAAVATSCTAPKMEVAYTEVAPGKLVRSEVAAAFEQAKASLQRVGIDIAVTSAHRTIERQRELIARNCKNPPGSLHCDPRPGRPPACMLAGMNPMSCPHTTGAAIDVFASGVRAADLCTNLDQEDCELPLEQQLVIRAMLGRGFCVHIHQLWHFEHLEATYRMDGPSSTLCTADLNHPRLQNLFKVR